MHVYTHVYTCIHTHAHRFCCRSALRAGCKLSVPVPLTSVRRVVYYSIA